MYRAGDQLLYYPEIPPNSRIFVPAPNTVDLPFENVFIKSIDSTKLHAYFIPQPQAHQCPTILFFHGNAGNIGHRLPNARGLFKHLQANILMVEYRGYGLSEGTPSESGLYKDAQAALNYLLNREDIDHRRIIVFGRSLGLCCNCLNYRQLILILTQLINQAELLQSTWLLERAIPRRSLV